MAQGLTEMPLLLGAHKSRMNNDNLTPHGGTCSLGLPWWPHYPAPAAPPLHLLPSPGVLPKALPAHPQAQLPALRATQEGLCNQDG